MYPENEKYILHGIKKVYKLLNAQVASLLMNSLRQCI
jgi:hypothetical protein